MTLDSLPPLRESLAQHGLLAKKSFGQHFLLDLNVTRKIARLAGPFEGRAVIEVGPGPGGLTRALLESDASKVIAVEKDPRFLPLLAELTEATNGKLVVVEADALEVDETALLSEHAGGAAGHLVSNLPYNVGTPLLLKWLTGPWRPRALTLMFQKEVADRVAAHASDDAYGRLAVISQAICEARVVMDLPARAFTPPPKVASAVVHLTPLPVRPSDADLKALERVTAAAFGQRRKMLRSSLKGLGGDALCEKAGIEPTARAEEIDVAGFLRLARAL
ncbi:16S rRNA (adenine(1518)-N(6)/adenine(1519)-N(6))-dimethyltransferase RsmA [Caulobacter sp. 17J80-11]|uniref:16S rRNA (adenine(1518)-N(6)/adenine(1519)-N(6))- dimethyltransferase RsmA n=1 Tax=Caulobacter sp. 17J80-11 TaxID=2763502 RepID=UPI0016539078|nr:16S rRNA (adenine(1518)-N(6)/adenine(1519)-N(6))-dimethyltransferase RsmA [Caulobacter sp. 17J80-11]MBC6983022.1 16S rRNA (adenine(1518)-N(6)/adenine(1519)-N(6))-dimethyltransferase RsmA [Caulobacter sp. 17J80-11]